MASGRRIICACKTLQKFSATQTLVAPAGLSAMSVRWATNKHYDPKWRKHRRMKVLDIDLPDYDRIRREAGMSVEERRAKRARDGLPPVRSGPQERNIVLGSSSEIFDPYKPWRGDGVASDISMVDVEREDKFLNLAFQKYAHKMKVGAKGKYANHRALKKIKEFQDFNENTFAEQALDIYVRAHECLMNVKKNEDELHNLVTERAYPEMAYMLDKRTFRWKLHEYLEPPRAVHARCTAGTTWSAQEKYAQVTCRFHTTQTIAIYDRFGRLQYGNENVIKDVLEYVVFENLITRSEGRWRIHGKIAPDWLQPRGEILRTMKKPKLVVEAEDKLAERIVRPVEKDN